ncbi:MAG: transposase [Chloroflexales bacterium]|nr:transposase [Chloroflexales bacterium]
MIRTHIEPCHLHRAEADALNRASGERYTQVAVFHWRTYRTTGHWLSPYGAEKWNDRAHAGQPALLHAHSVDAAQQGFYKACKTARECRRAGLDTHFPYKRKKYRTTSWKTSGMRRTGDTLLLARARGLPPIRITLPDHLQNVLAVREVRLVYARSKRRYFWHIVVENGIPPREAPGANAVAVDLGEVHPAAMSDGHDTVVITCRELRSQRQYTAKRLAILRQRQSACKRGSRLWKRLQRRINRFLHQQAKRTRDMEHKVSREVVNVAVAQEAGTIALGDVRDVADKGKLGKKSNQKVSNWSHGKLRQYITYKAEAEGISTELVSERATSQTCPHCRGRHKPRGRVYTCGRCGFSGRRDGVGAVNILSMRQHGEPGRICPTGTTTYRIPHNVRVLRSPLDTGHVACETQEAAAL